MDDKLEIEEAVEEVVSEMMVMDGMKALFKNSKNKEYAIEVFKKEVSKF